VGRGTSAILIAIVLAALWFTLSGRTEPMMLALGVVSIVVVVALAGRMDILDAETSGFRRPVSILLYWSWLGAEILKANIAVARAILKIDLDISPQLLKVRPSQRTDYGRAIFANSITLTPGTVTVDVDGSEFTVHALLQSMADPAGFEAMDRRVTRAAEPPPA
jgi:multicomponent Na+:H+ antiporter subunit E